MRPRESRRSVGTSTQPRKHRPDYILIILSLLLMIVGLIVIYSISPGLAAHREVGENYYIIKQLTALGLGVVAFTAAATIPFETWKKFRGPLIIAATVATLIALAMPVSEQYPAHRWIRVGGLSLQSVELVKFALLFVFAGFLVQKVKSGTLDDMKQTFRPIAIALLIMAIIIAKFQSDLGSMGVIVVMMMAMVFVAGIPIRRVFMFAGIIGVGMLLLISSSEYRRDRVLTFMQPERDCQNVGYQACQALIAVGSGGIAGKGLANSVQAYGYLPEAANDSIFAIYAEKFGFLGGVGLLALLFALFTRIKNIMERTSDLYVKLVVAGILAWLSTQAIINIGAMIGLLPLKGITLPFISYGGTSIIFVAALIGLVFNISRYTSFNVQSEPKEGNTHDHSAYRRRDRRAYYAPLGRRA